MSIATIGLYTEDNSRAFHQFLNYSEELEQIYNYLSNFNKETPQVRYKAIAEAFLTKIRSAPSL